MNSEQDNPTESTQPDEDSPEIESKSQRKRNAHQITAFAGTLVGMRPKMLASLPIDPPVLDAIKHCAEIKAHGARKRQLHYVSKLLREMDNIEEVKRLVENPELKAVKAKKENPHTIFRDQLLHDFAEHIDDLRENYPTVDLQQVRQLVRNAKKEATSKASESEVTIKITKTKAAKSLLRLLIESQ